MRYIGKAGDLRDRLGQHDRDAVAPSRRVRLQGLYATAAEVRWEVLDDEPAAVRREADLLVAFQPPYNASGSIGGWNYLNVDGDHFSLGPEPGERGRTYGCFPHLSGRGGSPPNVACRDGYLAFLRLLWAASTSEGVRFPAPLTTTAPPSRFHLPTWDGIDPATHAFLSGTSRRLLDDLARRTSEREAFLQPGLRRDLTAAEGFFGQGPLALRALRRRHGVGPGPLAPDQFRTLLAADVRAKIGEDAVFPTPVDPTPVSLVGGHPAASATRSPMERHVPRCHP
ncbi:MAG: hypothetical protein M3Q68_00715 [Actinomycetota bacterium]|nr:hypothetical protein [Actinomycetota bacterium]